MGVYRPCLTLVTEDFAQRMLPLRKVLNGLLYMVRGVIPYCIEGRTGQN